VNVDFGGVSAKQVKGSSWWLLYRTAINWSGGAIREKVATRTALELMEHLQTTFSNFLTTLPTFFRLLDSELDLSFTVEPSIGTFGLITGHRGEWKQASSCPYSTNDNSDFINLASLDFNHPADPLAIRLPQTTANCLLHHLYKRNQLSLRLGSPPAHLIAFLAPHLYTKALDLLIAPTVSPTLSFTLDNGITLTTQGTLSFFTPNATRNPLHVQTYNLTLNFIQDSIHNNADLFGIRSLTASLGGAPEINLRNVIWPRVEMNVREGVAVAVPRVIAVRDGEVVLGTRITVQDTVVVESFRGELKKGTGSKDEL
jgi:hypothetical protein